MQFGTNYLLPADGDNDRVNIDDAMHLNQEQVFSSWWNDSGTKVVLEFDGFLRIPQDTSYLSQTYSPVYIFSNIGVCVYSAIEKEVFEIY